MHCKDTILRTQNNWPYSKLIPNSGISEFMLVICDLSLQKGIRLSVSDKVDISKSFVDRVMMGNFAPYYYVTRYRQNGGNWEPYLEKYL